MKFREFVSLTPGIGVIFDGKETVVTKVTNITKGQTDHETDCLTGERTIYKSLHSTRELEISYADERTGNIQRMYPVVFIDQPNSTHNRCVLSRMKLWDLFEHAVKKNEREAR